MPETRSQSSHTSQSQPHPLATGTSTPSAPQHRQNGHATSPTFPSPTSSTSEAPTLIETATSTSTYSSPRYAPNGSSSLTSISLQSSFLGILLGSSLTACILLRVYDAESSLWRLPCFISICATFHFLEFYATARWNSGMCSRESFLMVGNGFAQPLAYAVALVEFAVRSFVCEPRGWIWEGWTRGREGWEGVLLGVGGLGVLVGQGARTGAMWKAGTSFNHLVQFYKREDHILITSGIYRYIRHPSYFGFFYWALGTQLVLGNTFSVVAYAFVLWKFFSHRVMHEERYLVSFFGDEYRKYRAATPTLIPFVGR